MTIVIPALAALVGAFVYLTVTNPKVAELGKLTFFAGVLVLVYILAGTTVSLLPR